MKIDYTSFISEHTAEYVLVPKLTNILRRQFETVIPIFPWRTREGSNLSKTLHRDDIFKVIGLYPRRPKINLNDDIILIKINSELLTGATEALKINIPMILGCPLARNLWELNENTKCIWIRLTDKTKSFYNVDCGDKISSGYNTYPMDEVLKNDDEVLNFLLTGSKMMDLEALVIAYQYINAHNQTFHYMGFGTYKPIYFLLREHRPKQEP